MYGRFIAIEITVEKKGRKQKAKAIGQVEEIELTEEGDTEYHVRLLAGTKNTHKGKLCIAKVERGHVHDFLQIEPVYALEYAVDEAYERQVIEGYS